MTGQSGSPRPRSRRPLKAEERELWTRVTRLVRPLDPATAPPPTPEPASIAGLNESRSAPRPLRHEPPPTKHLAPFERRLKQRLKRGLVKIEGAIDLHGLSVPDAHAVLTAFLLQARARRARVVLVITGKGRSRGAAGVLRQQVPLWLKSPAMRESVLAVAPANAGHGGEGALYVRLRRQLASPAPHPLTE
jgi:DNA-nicking Smr family endonuclease